MTMDNSTKLTGNQIGIVMNDIAIASRALERLSIMLLDNDDREEAEALNCSIRFMAQRVGLLADMVTERATSWIALSGDNIEEWMMPPAYHDEIKKEASHSQIESVEA